MNNTIDRDKLIDLIIAKRKEEHAEFEKECSPVKEFDKKLSYEKEIEINRLYRILGRIEGMGIVYDALLDGNA